MLSEIFLGMKTLIALFILYVVIVTPITVLVEGRPERQNGGVLMNQKAPIHRDIGEWLIYIYAAMFFFALAIFFLYATGSVVEDILNIIK